jgi:hypothetical protein
MATKLTTSTKILTGVYTVAMCADAADARIAMRQIIERMPETEAFSVYPAVFRRYMALRRLVVKLEGTDETTPTMYAPMVEPGTAPTAEQAAAAGRVEAPATPEAVDYRITGLTEADAYHKQVSAVTQINMALKAGQAVVVRSPGQVDSLVLSAQIFPEQWTSLPRLHIQLSDSVEQPTAALDTIIIHHLRACAVQVYH